MLKLTPQSMSEGMVTSILITDDNFREVINITPIPFEKIIQENIKKTISLYYLKKKTCENLVQQLEMAQLEFEEVKGDFDLLIHAKPEEKQVVEEQPKIVPPEPMQAPEVPRPEPTPEPIIKSEPIISAPEPSPPSLEEITMSIINSDKFKSLISNNQLSDVTIKAVISESTKPELVDTIYDMVMTQLKEKEIIEPTFFEKVGSIVKKRGRKPKIKE